MPFTLAHPIAIAPLWIASKRRLDLAALSIGAMVPDLDLYIPALPEGGHTLVGLFTLDLPCGIVLLIILRLLLVKPFVALLPPYLASCIPQPPLPNVIAAGVAILVGALSHIVWDAFTHESGWFVVHYSILQTQLGSWPLYKLLQHGCGVLGLLAVAVWIAWALGRVQPQQRPETLSLTYRIVIWSGIVAVALISAVIEIKTTVRYTREMTLVRGVVGSISGLGIGSLIYASGFWLRRGLNFNS